MLSIFLNGYPQAMHHLSLSEYEEFLADLPLLNGPHQVPSGVIFKIFVILLCILLSLHIDSFNYPDVV